jgi:hypothetical protein
VRREPRQVPRLDARTADASMPILPSHDNFPQQD